MYIFIHAWTEKDNLTLKKNIKKGFLCLFRALGIHKRLILTFFPVFFESVTGHLSQTLYKGKNRSTIILINQHKPRIYNVHTASGCTDLWTSEIAINSVKKISILVSTGVMNLIFLYIINEKYSNRIKLSKVKFKILPIETIQ